MTNSDEHRYDYMLDMPHRQSVKRRHMSVEERAAQFGAFRALTGYEDAIKETGRLTKVRLELDECKKEELDRGLSELKEMLEFQPEITVIYFVPDDKKTGGEYITYTERLVRIKEFEKKLVFADGKEINAKDICELSYEINY